MRDYQEIFNRWAHLSNSELLTFEEVGAYIELANRTNDPQYVNKALLNMDFDTYNAISILKFLKDDNFAEKLRTYDAFLVPLLTTGRTLDVLNDNEVLQYFISMVSKYADGFLLRIAETLDVLNYKVITETSKVYTDLLTFGYSPVDIAYLNYTWLKQKVGQGLLKKLQCRLLSSLFELTTSFTERQKEIIQEVINCHEHRVTDLVWTKQFECSRVENDDNWEWLYGLVQEEKLHLNCIKPRPILAEDTSRFCILTYYEKLQCMDADVKFIEYRLRLEDMLNRVQFREYLDSFNRDIPMDTITNLAKLGYVGINELNLDQQYKVLRGITNRFSYEVFINNADYQNLKYLRISYANHIDCKRDFLNEDEQRLFISKILELSFNTDYDLFLQTLCSVIMDPDLVKLYDNQLLIDIVDYIKETLKSHVDFHKISKMLRNVLPSAEFQEFERAEKEKQELEELHREEELTAKKIAEMQEKFNNVESPEDLIETYNWFSSRRYLYNTDSVNEFLLTTATDKFFNNTNMTESLFKVLFLLWEKKLISYEIFKDLIGSKEVA